MSNDYKVFYVRTLLDNDVKELTIYVDPNGSILDIKLGKEPQVSGYLVEDLTSSKLIALPGFIDIHVHFRDFTLSYKEDMISGSMAALSSGYVLVCDMPNTKPTVNNVELLKRRVELAKANSYVDYGAYCGIPDDLKTLTEVLRHKNLFVGFKIYPEDLSLRYEVVKAILEKYEGLVVIHAELPEYSQRDYVSDVSLRHVSRPSWNEISLLKLLTDINRNSKLHITHSTHPTTPSVCKSLGVTVDTTPYYFLFSNYDVLDCWRKVNPPIQDLLTKTLVFRNFTEGLYDAVVSDHAPHSLSEKSLDWRVCPSGFAAIEVVSKIMLTFFTKGVIDYNLLLKYLCRGPASILGLSNYGCLRRGCRASFTLVDLGREGVITGLKYSKAGKSGFEGLRYRGEVVKTVIGGEVVYDSGEVVAKPKVLVISNSVDYVEVV